MFGLGIWELSIILMIIVVLFGASRLPELGKGVGSALTNFKKATRELDDIKETADSDTLKKGVE